MLDGKRKNEFSRKGRGVVEGASRLGSPKERDDLKESIKFRDINPNESQQEWMYAMVNHLDTIKKQIEKGGGKDEIQMPPLPTNQQNTKSFHSN